MAAQKGRSMLLKIGDGTSPGVFTTIGGLRSKNLTINNETVDITTGDEAPWRLLLENAGIRSLTVSGSGVFEDDVSINLVETISFNGTFREFQMVFQNGDIIEGDFQVTSFQYAGEHNGEQTYSMSLASSGIITLTRA